MNLIALAAVVVAIAVVVLVIALVPTVLQHKKTLAAGEEVFKGMKALMENEVSPAIKSLDCVLHDMEGVVKGAREGVEKIDDALEAFRKVGDTVKSINLVLEKAVKPPIINAASWLTGVKVGLGTLVEALKHSKSKEVQ